MYKVAGRTQSGVPFKTFYTDSMSRALNAREKFGAGIQITEEKSPLGVLTGGTMYKVAGRTQSGVPFKTFYTDSMSRALNAREKFGTGIQITEEKSPQGVFTVVGRYRGVPIKTKFFDSYAEALNVANDMGGSVKPVKVNI